MTDYPNREHKNADDAARRRALAALTDLAGEAALLHRSVKAGLEVDGDFTQVLTDLVRKLTRDLTVLGTLRDVREWHAADSKEAAGDDA